MPVNLRERIDRELIFRSLLSMGRTAPNPGVAALLLLRKSDEQGYCFVSGGTEPPGKRHAEIVCLDTWRSLQRIHPDLIPETLFVTLEPCSKTGRTPPCTGRIRSHPEIKRIQTAILDPTLKKEGMNLLQEYGFETEIADPEGIGATFLEGWTGRMRGSGPRFHAKIALSLDGAIGHASRRIIISGRRASRFSMILRSRMDAIIVGPGTVAVDLPGLDVRHDERNWKECYRERIVPSDHYLEDSISGLPGSTPDDRDPIIRGILMYETFLLGRIASDSRANQPDRIFILGRPFARSEEFFRKQKVIGDRTGKDPIFLLLRKTAHHWKNLPGNSSEIGDISDENFGEQLRNFCSSAGYNEVMIEGGARLFDGMRNQYQERDRFYLIRSKSVTIQNLEGRIVNPPGYFRGLKEKAVFDLGEDILTLANLPEGSGHDEHKRED